jgi:hypothetical protein
MKAEAEELTRVIGAIASVQGQPLRCSALGSQLGISGYRVRQCIRILEQKGILYMLPAWDPPGVEAAGRLVRSSVVYLRGRSHESALSLAGSSSGQSAFCSRMIEQIMVRERARSPESRFGHHCTPLVVRAALVVTRPSIKVGFVFTTHPVPSKHLWIGLRKSIRAEWLDRGFVLYPGQWAFFGGRGIVAVPAGTFLAGYREWMEAAERGVTADVRELVGRCNGRPPWSVP